MKRANGTGTVYKLKDTARRRPWVAAMSVKDSEGFRTRQIIGCFATRKEANEALAEYIVDPTDLRYKRATYAEIYELWYKRAENRLVPNSLKNYQAGFRACKDLHDRIFTELRAADLQDCLDHSGKNAPTLSTMKKSMWHLYQFALENDIVKKDYSAFVHIPKRAENPNPRPHVPYTDEEISLLWEHSDDELAAFQLMLIYCGARITELLDLRCPDDVDLENQCFTIKQSKTRAGIRTVPIADKVLPLWQRLASREALLIGDTGAPIKYQRARVLWDKYNESLGIRHLPHDARHTCVTKLSDAGVSKSIIKKIVGHKEQDVTDEVYDHKTIAQLLDAVNKI